MNILFRVPLAIVVCALCTLPPHSSTTALAEDSVDGHKARVIWLEPNGIDDTSNLQSAFDSCTDPSYPCKIKLASGVFHTAPVVATNFHGEVRGAGQGVTIIRALTDRVLHLSQAVPFYLFDPTPEEPWNSFVQFVEGDVLIQGLTIHIPGDTRTDGWWTVCGIFKIPVFGGGLATTGRDPQRFVVRNVSVLGGETGQDWPFSVNAGIGVLGFMLREGSEDCLDIVPARGEFIFDSNYVSTTFEGTIVDNVEEGDIRVTRSRSDTSDRGVQVWDAVRSKVYIASNQVETDFDTGISLLQNNFNLFGLPTVEGATEYTVVDNHITVGGPGFAGVDYFDFREGFPLSTLNVSGNTVHVGNDTFAGISLDRTIDSRVVKNRVSGTAGFGGVTMFASSNCKVGLNDFSGFDTDVTDILLYEDTTNCRVQAFSGDTVEDLGTDNRVFFK